MGAVYRAEHIHMKKTVALKVLHPSHTRDPEVVERFQREAQAAANIEHPNICAATDFGKLDQDFYYLVMEYLEGRPLIDVIKAGEDFSPLRALHIAIQILLGLERAHEVGVVHRDLKPENVILVEREGDPDFVKITDFGVAQVRLFKDAARLTQAGVVYGSPLYMSPQQAAGKEIDHRADLYSVGVMLYELLTGQLPFYAKSLMVVLNMHIADPPPRFSEACPDRDIPPELELIVMRLLAKEPEDRYQSAVSAREDLERVRDELTGGPEVDAGDRNRRVITGLLIFLAGVIVLWGAFLVGKFVIGSDSDPGTDVGQAMTFEDSSSTEPDDDEPERKTVPRPHTEKKRQNFIESNPAVTRAVKLLDEDPEKALEAFVVVERKLQKNPHAKFLLGRANFANDNWDAAFAAYAEAIDLEPAYADDSQLQNDVMSRLEESSDEDSEPAETLVKMKMGAAANPRLAELAEHHKVRKIRKRALRILRESGQFEALPRWKQLTIQLRHAIGCEENRKWIVKIGETGDPRALGALRRFSALPKTGCGKDEQEDCYECLRYDLGIAIDKLESPPPGGTGGG
jgi:serine/threonine-protein kinase